MKNTYKKIEKELEKIMFKHIGRYCVENKLAYYVDTYTNNPDQNDYAVIDIAFQQGGQSAFYCDFDLKDTKQAMNRINEIIKDFDFSINLHYNGLDQLLNK